MPLKQHALYTCQFFWQASTLTCPSSTTLHPELQLQQTASDVTSARTEEAANVVHLQSHVLSQTHQLQVATDIHLGNRKSKFMITWGHS